MRNQILLYEKTKNEVALVKEVASKIASLVEYDGIAPRWLFFANLIDPFIPDNRILSTISVIDSAHEIKIGLGKHFESTKVIRER